MANIKKVQHAILEFFGKLSGSSQTWISGSKALEVLANAYEDNPSTDTIKRLLEEKSKQGAGNKLQRKMTKYKESIKDQPLLSLLRIVEADNDKQFQQDCCYKRVMQIRNDKGIDAESYDEVGLILLHWAVLCNRPNDVGELANIDAVNKETDERSGISMAKATPILLATIQKNLPIAKMLIRRGAVPNIESTYGISAQSVATEKGLTEFTSFFEELK